MDAERRCETCRFYLGNGCCRLDLEDECGAGGFEAWEQQIKPKEANGDD